MRKGTPSRNGAVTRRIWKWERQVGILFVGDWTGVKWG